MSFGEDFNVSFDNKNSALTDLRNEVQQLRDQNKTLARQLHIERYIKKSKANQKILDLRATNYQTEQETMAIRNRVEAVNKQIESRQNIAKIRQKQIDDIESSIEEMSKEIQDLTNETESFWQQNEITASEIAAKKLAINSLVAKLKETISLREEEQSKRKIVAENLKYVNGDLEKEQEKLEVLGRVEKDVSKKNEELQQTKSQLEKEIKDLENEFKKNGEKYNIIKETLDGVSQNNNNLKKEKQKKEKEYNGLLVALQKPPSSSSYGQTDGIKIDGKRVVLGNNDNIGLAESEKQSDQLNDSFDVIDKSNRFSFTNGSVKSICKITGVYGCNDNTSFKGRNLEIMSKDHEAFVQLNIKFKK